jgi:hypothetical protein
MEEVNVWIVWVPNTALGGEKAKPPPQQANKHLRFIE